MAPLRETALGPRAIGRGNKAKVVAPAVFGPGSYSYTVPESGVYRISLWGGGGAGAILDPYDTTNFYQGGGGAGGFCQTSVRLAKNSVLTITVGKGGRVSRNSGAGLDSTVVQSGVVSLTASGGSAGGLSASPPAAGGAGGSASGGTINITGGAGGASNSGGSAATGDNPGVVGTGDPSNGGGGSAGGVAGMRGGNGGYSAPSGSNFNAGSAPGGGGRGHSWTASHGVGGDGLCVVAYEGA